MHGFSFDSPSFIVEQPAAPAPPPASSSSPGAPGRNTAQASDFGFTFEEERDKPAPASTSSFAAFSFDSPSTPAAPEPPSKITDALSSFPFGNPTPAPAPPANDSPFGGFSFDAPSAPAAAPPAAPASAPPSGGFSFDAPSSAPSSSSGGSFDFSTASIETTPDDQLKIDQYLTDGDRAYDAGDYQQAIDLWSRIFLIDVTNEQASERIERAKAKRREAEQKVEAMLAAAISAYDKRDTETARKRFTDILALDPHNSTATDYLERLDEGTATPDYGSYEPPSTDLDGGLFDDDMGGGHGTETLIPPDPTAAPAAPAASSRKSSTKIAAAPKVKEPSAKKSPLGLIATLLAVVLLGAGGWFVWQRFVAKPAYDPAATQAIFEQAQSLAQRGKYDQAISMLQDIKPDDPQHDKALVLISDLQHKKSQAAEMIDGRPAAVVYQEGLANGKAAFDAHDYEGAKNALELAARVRPLPPDMKLLYDQAASQVAKLDGAKALFRERKYQDAISSLEPLLAQDPQNKSIQRIITDAHFNLGANALQEEKLPEAMKEFDEVLKNEPNDELARRSKELAARYDGQQKDLLYRIYVKYLPLRQVG